MRYFSLALIAACCLTTALATTLARVPASDAVPVNNFYWQVKSIVQSVPHKEIQRLVRAYALNDAGFQSLLRAINSLPAYRLRQQFLQQPEVRQLIYWLAQQLKLAGGSIEVFEDLEIEIKLFNKYPHWAQSVNGVAGFQQEFYYLYPLKQLRDLLESSAQENPVFAELWRRLLALKSVYERLTSSPQAKDLANRLRALGVDINGLDERVRYQMGWSNATISDNVDYVYNDYLDGVIIN